MSLHFRQSNGNLLPFHVMFYYLLLHLNPAYLSSILAVTGGWEEWVVVQIVEWVEE